MPVSGKIDEATFRRFVRAVRWVEQQMSRGVKFVHNPPNDLLPRRPKLFELFSELSYPENGSDAPSAEAYAVTFDDESQAYIADAVTPRYTLYLPTAIRDDDGFYIGLPLLRAEMRVWAIHDASTGRWNISEYPRQQTWAGTLDEELVVDGSAEVSVGELTITAYDALLQGADVLDAATEVFIAHLADDNKFYVIAAECQA